jgi:hypothetical protein
MLVQSDVEFPRVAALNHEGRNEELGFVLGKVATLALEPGLPLGAIQWLIASQMSSRDRASITTCGMVHGSFMGFDRAEVKRIASDEDIGHFSLRSG